MLAITLALVAYGLISRKIEGSILTGPTLFTVFGLVAGPAALGLIPLQMGNEALHAARRGHLDSGAVFRRGQHLLTQPQSRRGHAFLCPSDTQAWPLIWILDGRSARPVTCHRPLLAAR